MFHNYFDSIYDIYEWYEIKPTRHKTVPKPEG